MGGSIYAGLPTISVGAQSGFHRDITVTLPGHSMASIWLSSTALGAPAGSPPNGGTSATTGTIVQGLSSDVYFQVLSSAASVIVLRLADSGTPTFYVNVAVGTQVVTSSAITFA